MEENTWSFEEMKQTLNLLKKALIIEREERKQVKSDLLQIISVVSNAEQDLKDKV